MADRSQPQDSSTSVPPHPWRPGYQIRRRDIALYEVVRPLSRVDETLSGVAYLVQPTSGIQHQLVVKVINPYFVTDLQTKANPLSGSEAREEAERRMRIEAEAIAAIQSDFVVRYHDFVGGEESNVGPYLVMEYIKGVMLTECLGDRTPELQRPLDVAHAVARGVVDIHRAGYLHLDLKPGNIMVSGDSETRKITIIDFSISRRIGSELRTRFHAGSLGFVAPEATETARSALTEAADVYALGKVIGGLFHPKFGSGRSDVTDRDLELIPPVVRDLVRRATADDPAQRPSSAALANELRALASVRTSPSIETPASPRQTPLNILLAGVAIVFLIALLVVGSQLLTPPVDQNPALASRSTTELPIDVPPAKVANPEAPTPSDSLPAVPPAPLPPDAKTPEAKPLVDPAKPKVPTAAPPCPKALVDCINETCPDLISYPLKMSSSKVSIPDKSYGDVARKTIKNLDGCMEEALRCRKHLTAPKCKTQFLRIITKA